MTAALKLPTEEPRIENVTHSEALARLQAAYAVNGIKWDRAIGLLTKDRLILLAQHWELRKSQEGLTNAQCGIYSQVRRPASAAFIPNPCTGSLVRSRLRYHGTHRDDV